VANSSVPFLQWQAKSVRPEQPSVVRGVMKQVKAQDGMLSSWAEATEARAIMEATAKVFILACVWMLRVG
jgi:hypothetical protein